MLNVVRHDTPAASAMLKSLLQRPPVFVFFLMAAASIFTPGRTQCHVVTIFGLKTADCNKQNVKIIPRTLDRDLQVVRFDDNRLVRLDSDEFRIYPNLQEIYLARNHIESMSQKAFHGLFSLQILDLEGNQLASIPSDSFQTITSLRMLSLKGNPIRRIEMGALTSLRNVEELNFENCWLDAIDPSAFRGLEKLVEINLVNNELHGLDPEMSTSLPSSLSVLRLYRNPWSCNCRLRWLRKWIAVPGAVNWDFATNTPTCAAPELIKGVAWKHLSPDQFACPTRIVFNATRTSATVEEGLNVTLECLAIGDPEPVVSWLRDGGKELPRGSIFAENRGSTESGEKLVTSVVTMLRVGHDEAGDYRCSAENSAGRSEMTYKVLVQDLGASPGGFGRLDADRETLLGVIVGIGILAVIVVAVTVCRVKFRQCQKHGYDEDAYAKNLTPLTKKKDTTEEEEVDSEEEDNDEEEEEEEQDDSSFADSFNFQAKSIGNAKTDSTLQSLLGPKKSNAADVLSNRSDDFTGSDLRAQTHHRRQKTKHVDRLDEDDDEDEEISESYKASAAAKKKRCSSVVFDEASPSPSASEKSDRSSTRTDSDHDKRKSTPDLLSGGGGGTGGGASGAGASGGCAENTLQRPTSRLQIIGPPVSRSDRSVSFSATPHEAHTKDESRLPFRREASSSAETLVIDDVMRRTVTTDAHAKTEGPKEEEKALMGLTSNGKLSPSAVRFLTVDRLKAAEKTSVGLHGRGSLSCNTVHFPEHSSGQADLMQSSNCGTVEGSYSSLGKSCLRKKQHPKLPPYDNIPVASGTNDRNFADVMSDQKRTKIDACQRRQEHQRLLPRIPLAGVSFREGSQRVTSETVGNGPFRDRLSMGGGPHRDHTQNGVHSGGSPGTIGGFMQDGMRWIEGSLQRMTDIALPGNLTTSCHSANRSSLSHHQNPLLAVNSTISPPTSTEKLRRDTNRAFPTRPFDTLPIIPCSNRGQSSNRPDSSLVDFAASDRFDNRTSCSNQNYNQPSKLKKQPHLVQQQQHHVTLLSDILLSPFGKDSMTSSSNANDVRTRADNRRQIVLDEEDDAGTAL